MSYQLNVLGIALTYSGSILLEYKDLLVRVIAAAFDAPSIKVVLLLIASDFLAVLVRRHCFRSQQDVL